MTIDVNDPEVLIALDSRARSLAGIANAAFREEQIDAMHRAAQSAFVAQGQSDIEAYLAADAIVQRLRQLVANYKRAAAGRGQAQARWDGQR